MAKNFKSIDSLKSVEVVINETSEALKDKKRSILHSTIPDVLAGAVGAGLGGAGSFAVLFLAGTKGLSAVGITTGLAAAGKIVGGGMVAGIGVLALPAVILGGTSILVATGIKRKKLTEAKDRLLKLAIEKQHAITVALKEEVETTKDRADYLNRLNILLLRAIRDLKADMT